MQRIVSIGALILGLCSGCGEANSPGTSDALPNFPGLGGSTGAAGQAATPSGNGGPPGASGGPNPDNSGETNPDPILGNPDQNPGTGGTPISSPLPRSTPEAEGVSSA